VADITGLDRLGVPTYSCIRPAAIAFSVAGVSVTCGKGTSREQAKAGALMEALEYYSAEPGALPLRHESFAQLARTAPALDPRELILPTWSPYREDRKLYWVEGRDIATGESWWIPANAVFHPFVPAEGEAMILRGNTAGLASGNAIEEAICHGLAEAIEQDAWSISVARAAHGLDDFYPGIILERLDGELEWLFGRFADCGVSLSIRDITSDLGVPTYTAASVEVAGLQYLLHGGLGAHVDPSIALTRALTETAQSRAADIQGSREDLAYLRGKRQIDKQAFEQNQSWEYKPSTHSVVFPPPLQADHADIRDDILWMLERLKSRGLTRAFVVDLTRAELGVPVVRVVVPGLEHVGVDEYRIGPRVRAALGSPTP